jgi:hypothetical protein
MMRRRKRYEQLLDSAGADDDPLTHALAAARAPADTDELAGLDAALAAYATAAAGSQTLSRNAAGRPSRLRPVSVLRGMAAASLVTKIVAGAVAAAAVGGIALAATSEGHHHAPMPHPGTTTSATGRPSSSAPSSSGVGSAPPSSSSSPTGPRSVTGPPSSGVSLPPLNESFRGLCQAWISRPPNNGNADNTPAVARLITAAGGADKVEAYCVALLATPGSTSPAPSVTATHRTGKPSAPPGKPTGSPTKKYGK